MLKSIYWEITSKCNLNCKHCYNGENLSKDSVFDKEKSLETIELLASYGIKDIFITGGEPFLNENLFFILEKCYDRSIYPSILTNGTLINDFASSEFHRTGVKAVQISFDGVNKTHELIRGKDTFDKVEFAIDSLRKHKVPVILKTTINEQNKDDLEEVVKYSNDKGITIKFSLAQEIGNTEKNQAMISPKDYFNLFLKLYSLKKQGNRLTLPDFAIEEYLTNGKISSKCGAGRDLAVITFDNKLLPCPFMGGIGLKRERLTELNGDSLINYKNIPIFKIITKENERYFDCPLRRRAYGGKDPYSIYSFIDYLKNGTIQI